jgi:intracellular sulfur oxidation DsrE/DsrF family protein
VPIIAEATIVPAGVVRLVELQEQGYSYIKP